MTCRTFRCCCFAGFCVELLGSAPAQLPMPAKIVATADAEAASWTDEPDMVAGAEKRSARAPINAVGALRPITDRCEEVS